MKLPLLRGESHQNCIGAMPNNRDLATMRKVTVGGGGEETENQKQNKQEFNRVRGG